MCLMIIRRPMREQALGSRPDIIVSTSSCYYYVLYLNKDIIHVDLTNDGSKLFMQKYITS